MSNWLYLELLEIPLSGIDRRLVFPTIADPRADPFRSRSITTHLCRDQHKRLPKSEVYSVEQIVSVLFSCPLVGCLTRQVSLRDSDFGESESIKHFCGWGCLRCQVTIKSIRIKNPGKSGYVGMQSFRMYDCVDVGGFYRGPCRLPRTASVSFLSYSTCC